MRGRDEDTGEFRGDSRSQQRRAALDVLSLGEKLVALTPAQLAKLPVPESLIPHIEESKRITSHIAHKRQLAFLAKQMRREDDATLDAIREAMDANSDGARREVAAIHRVEGWRARLLADGDSALSELLTEHPEAERQRLRQLIRNAKEERLKNKPPHAYRELFRELRELVLGADAGLGTRDSGLEAADPDAIETDPDERD
ncbi:MULTISPECIES: ribosome biogenesis factor YjgA [Xanthomonas translucens group]|uniref:Dual-action ribosomal maturation protein DarP n=1 Tax=Xanthomonas cerealis pv. cerealis TaxID=152263 RepID=A0A514EDK0_9XANT|nr:ribosome biogenesis factor YjgA [Xanthomonas translucens]QDI04126.1 ribosome-associated protein [Xanthomonas translucens pv. cerealis]UKE46105.1 ribosome-associated protein [Xanthomonas translucens pv. cerealis]UKE68459.1 ribosome-associated protein [Xanthomonas translucens pv. pistacia]